VRPDSCAGTRGAGPRAAGARAAGTHAAGTHAAGTHATPTSVFSAMGESGLVSVLQPGELRASGFD